MSLNMQEFLKNWNFKKIISGYPKFKLKDEPKFQEIKL